MQNTNKQENNKKNKQQKKLKNKIINKPKKIEIKTCKQIRK